MNSSNSADNRTLPYHDNELDIPVVAEVIGVSETEDQILNHPPAPPVEVFTTVVINISELLVAETLTKYGTLYDVGFKKRSYKGMGGGLATSGSESFVIPIGVPNFLFCLSFA